MENRQKNQAEAQAARCKDNEGLGYWIYRFGVNFWDEGEEVPGEGIIRSVARVRGCFGQIDLRDEERFEEFWMRDEVARRGYDEIESL